MKIFKAVMVTCPSCSHTFDITKVPEEGMGYVLCPKCKKVVTQ